MMQRLRLDQTNVAGAPDLRDRVVFEQRVSKDDGAGNIVDAAWRAAFPSVAAAITPLLGGESVMQERLASRQPVIIKVRYSRVTLGIVTDMRVRNRRTGMIYQVKSVADTEGTRRFLDVLCQTGVDA
jgi:SPP1 family predicted phage head-tail adaptor